MRIIIAVCVLLFAGCSPQYQMIKNDSIDPDKAAKLIVYRPDGSFHKYNPEEPFVFLNNKKIGNIGVGKTLETQIGGGKNIVTIKGNMLGIPTSKAGEVELTAEKGKTYYVRYSYDFSYFIGTTAVGDSALRIVGEEYGQKRR